jgi:assimilatory nitrate reductase catalytic subunit
MTASLNLEPTFTLTTCPYCAVQCSFEIEHATQPDGREALIGLRSTPRCPVAHGSVCKKGLAALEEPNHPERLLSPLVRKNGKLVPASWNAALERVTNIITSVQQNFGRDAFAVFGGGSLTNEKVYLLGKFARVALRTANIDYNGRFCMSTAGAAMRQTYGLDRGLPFPLERVSEASCIVLWGSNLAETLPPIAQFLTRARKRGSSIIVVDPRATPSTKLGTIHIPVQPGGDLALALGLQNVIVSENWQNQDFLEARTSGWDAVAASVQPYTPEWAAEKSGLNAGTIRELARLMAEKSREPGGLLILSGRGPEQQSQGVDTIKAMINLALSLGGFYAPLTGQGNGQGGREHGQKADQLPGYQLIENPEARAKISEFWGIAESDLPRKGLSAQELLEACGSAVKGLFVIGSNPVVSAANSTNVSRKLEALDGLVVVDFFLSETAALADVVLPGSMWLEEDGTMTNLEGRVLRRRQVSNPPGEARTDWQILCEIAQRLGMCEGFHFSSPREIFDELARATRGAPADYSGISYERLEDDGIFWPCPSADHPGTPEPFKTSFAHADGLAHLSVVTHKRNPEQTNSAFPVWLSTGRLAEHYQSGTQTRRNPRLNKVTRPSLELHPNLAAQHKLEPGDRVRVTTARGEAEFDVTISSKIREDTIFAPFHFAGLGSVNRLTDPTLDPISKMPAFKVAAASIERIPIERIPIERITTITDSFLRDPTQELISFD